MTIVKKSRRFAYKLKISAIYTVRRQVLCIALRLGCQNPRLLASYNAQNLTA
jgi:hypothetical protein